MIVYDTQHTSETRLKSSVDRLEEYRNVPTIDLTSDAETPRGLKRKLPEDLCI